MRGLRDDDGRAADMRTIVLSLLASDGAASRAMRLAGRAQTHYCRGSREDWCEPTAGVLAAE